MSEENQGFTVTDKRIKLEAPGQESRKDQKQKTPTEEAKKPAGQEEKAPPDFSGFILSLGTSALIHLGENALPNQKPSEINLPYAKEIIDILSILEEKTKGNLTREESGLLSNLLYTLRMKFVELKNKSSDIRLEK